MEQEDLQEEKTNEEIQSGEKLKQEIVDKVRKEFYKSDEFKKAVQEASNSSFEKRLLENRIKIVIPKFKKEFESLEKDKDAYKNLYEKTKVLLDSKEFNNDIVDELESNMNSMIDTAQYIQSASKQFTSEGGNENRSFEYKGYGGVSHFGANLDSFEANEYPETNRCIHKDVLASKGKTIDQLYPKSIVKIVQNASGDDIGIVNLYSKKLKNLGDIFDPTVSSCFIENDTLDMEEVELLRNGIKASDSDIHSRVKYSDALNKSMKISNDALKNIEERSFVENRIKRII